jgi:hypothetical protein
MERLPGWIRSRVEVPASFGQAYGKLHRFFRERQAQTVM